MSQHMRLHIQAHAEGYSCICYMQMVAVKWHVVYTSLEDQLGFRLELGKIDSNRFESIRRSGESNG